MIHAATRPPGPSTTEKPAGIDDTDKGHPATILVVEDDWLIATEIEACLVDAGYDVPAIAFSADQAVELAGRLAPDLVLMDIRLEGRRDGIDAAQDILDRFGIRSLYISANSDPATKIRAEATHPVGWLPKPFSGSQLVAAVRLALRAVN